MGYGHHKEVRWEGKWKGTLKRRVNRDEVSEVYLNRLRLVPRVILLSFRLPAWCSY